jgi:hypothetical protein
MPDVPGLPVCFAGALLKTGRYITGRPQFITRNISVRVWTSNAENFQLLSAMDWFWDKDVSFRLLAPFCRQRRPLLDINIIDGIRRRIWCIRLPLWEIHRRVSQRAS